MSNSEQPTRVNRTDYPETAASRQQRSGTGRTVNSESSAYRRQSGGTFGSGKSVKSDNTAYRQQRTGTTNAGRSSSAGRKAKTDLPSTEQLEEELKRSLYKKSFQKTLWNTIYTLITVAAIAVLVAVLLLPVLRIYGTSMSPTLEEGSIVISLKGSKFNIGDVVAFYYNNKILVKRVIASAGDWVDIDENGYVYVNNVKIDEPYLDPAERALGECNIKLPYQVPESRIFVLGDNRSTSVDSRNTAVGCVAEEQVVGRISFCVWPFSCFGAIN